MKYCTCWDCDARFEMLVAKPQETGKREALWLTVCPNCGHENIIDIDDYIMPIGTLVATKTGGQKGRVKNVLANQAKDFASIPYFVCFENGEKDILTMDKLRVIEDWRLTRRQSDGAVRRVCHSPRNTEDSNVPCYNCADGAKCFRMILERLAEYEGKFGPIQ